MTRYISSRLKFVFYLIFILQILSLGIKNKLRRRRRRRWRENRAAKRYPHTADADDDYYYENDDDNKPAGTIRRDTRALPYRPVLGNALEWGAT